MKFDLRSGDQFVSRHIGPTEDDIKKMLEILGVPSIDVLIDQTIPEAISLPDELDLPEAMSEERLLRSLADSGGKNKRFKSFIGLGFYDCIVPAVIRRNIFENPGWYTQYTPYQAEISQGRLEALLNFQTLILELTAMEIANASLLDEATAAAEAMTMLHRLRDREQIDANAGTFFVSDKCLPQTIDVLKTRAEPLGIQLEIGDWKTSLASSNVFGALLQFPDVDGLVQDYSEFIEQAHERRIRVTVAADLLALTLLQPPGEMGADVVVGSSQRFGVPLAYGGPHAAFFATRDEFKRQLPGRVIGVSVDVYGKRSYRMALQTREQHIRREKATSNICTAQALLAIMAGMYATYHGASGLKRIAGKVHVLAQVLAASLAELGYTQENRHFFDTLRITVDEARKNRIRGIALKAGYNFCYGEGYIRIALDETASFDDIETIAGVFVTASSVKQGPRLPDLVPSYGSFPDSMKRESAFLTHPVFTRYRSETGLMRYIKSLENKDLSLTHSMIPLGSCTMKLNATAEMEPVSWPEFANIHPFAPEDQSSGYREIFTQLEAMLCEITGLAAVSLQPNSGAQGEYAGLLVIRAWHKDRGEGFRNVVLIPSSAHGTNPASAIMSGMKVVIVKCDDLGNIDRQDLATKAQEHADNLAALMVTYPSTHGVYESGIREICSIIHEYGGQVYMDGANLNAQVGLTNPAIIGADVCHLNLHKTFSIPHGGGGPGMGPIAVAEHLTPYLPKHVLVETGGQKGISAVSAAPWGSAGILLIPYAYIKMLGRDGVKRASEIAILNANYIKARLEKVYPILYKGEKGRVAHEMIFDFRPFRQSAKIEVEDVAKRLMDYGFHAPTVSFPVPGTLMVEPTESEDKAELDRFCDAMLSIREEIREIEEGKSDASDNVLTNAPHTAAHVTADTWTHPYSREKAAFPLPYLMERKFWPSVGRIDNAYGDRNLVCACPPIESYED
jgi:glycine dehydrogenase